MKKNIIKILFALFTALLINGTLILLNHYDFISVMGGILMLALYIIIDWIIDA